MLQNIQLKIGTIYTKLIHVITHQCQYNIVSNRSTGVQLKKTVENTLNTLPIQSCLAKKIDSDQNLKIVRLQIDAECAVFLSIVKSVFTENLCGIPIFHVQVVRVYALPPVQTYTDYT